MNKDMETKRGRAQTLIHQNIHYYCWQLWKPYCADGNLEFYIHTLSALASNKDMSGYRMRIAKPLIKCKLHAR